MTAALLSDVGCHRTVNEDCVRYVSPGDAEALARRGVLALVADGMGGHSAGEVASRLAVDAVHQCYYGGDVDDVQQALTQAFLEANRQIYETSLTDDRLRGMGTTCTALVLHDSKAFSSHVGDSRLYLARGGEIYLMTEDHSAVGQMVSQGLLTLAEARHHTDRNVILRALGTRPEVEVANWRKPFPVRAGDQFLLCSDGLHDLVEEAEMKEALLSEDPYPACERLIALARVRGGYDNITVAILSLKTAARPSANPVRATRTGEVPR